MIGESISLQELLDSRDLRAQKQRNLIARFPGCTLICLTVIMPGNVKRSKETLCVAKAAVDALNSAFDDYAYFEACDLVTGYEAYALIKHQPCVAKRICCQIEDSHPLGRLFDLDVLSDKGVPLSRRELGFAPRKCLICGRDARLCMRERTHSQQELQLKISEIILHYER